MSYLPSELVTDIFSRLAVEPLLRFRCVSKPWCGLIDNPDFIKFHLNRNILTNSHRTLILECKNSIYSLDFASLNNRIPLNHPLKHLQSTTKIVGSCNGMLCLYNFNNKVIVLWKPSTRSHHRLPHTDFRFPTPYAYAYGHCVSIIFGFGYDHVNDDYKVVQMIQFFDNSFDFQVVVYSLKSNLPRRIRDFPYNLCYRENGILANGALHWVATRRSGSNRCKLIAALDLGTEEYRLVPLPDYDYSDTYLYMTLGLLGGSLCVTNLYLRSVDIWVLKDYGVNESWTKLVSVAQPNDVGSLYFGSPITYSKSGEQVLLRQDSLSHGQFVWYGLERKHVETVTVCGLQYIFRSNVCVESLVKLPRDGGRGKNLPSVEKGKNDKKKNKQVPKKRLDLVSVRDDFILKVSKVSRWCSKKLEETIKHIGS